jgi:hypothetical protein
MQELTDRQLIDRELTRYSAAGWQIVSQSESSFQVGQSHVVSSAAMVLLVAVPLGLGVFLSLFSVAVGTVLFWLALLCAILLTLDHLSARPKLLYITADQLRTPTPASIEYNARGVIVCSVCQTPTRIDATACENCKRYYGITPVFSGHDRPCLDNLRTKGLVSDAEYAQKRQKLLDEM